MNMVCTSICLCLNFLFSVLEFSEYRSFTSMVRFIPRYFILFVAIVNGIFPLVSLSDNSLLVYKNALNICTLLVCKNALEY